MDLRREAPCGSNWNTQAGTMAWPSCSFRAIITAQGQGSPEPSVLSLGSNAVAKVLASAARVLWVPWRKHHRALWGQCPPGLGFNNKPKPFWQLRPHRLGALQAPAWLTGASGQRSWRSRWGWGIVAGKLISSAWLCPPGDSGGGQQQESDLHGDSSLERWRKPHDNHR